MQICMFSGRLTKDVLLEIVGGYAKAFFTVAVRRDFKNSDKKFDSDYIPCVAWRQLGENCKKYMSKGSKCSVVGKWQQRNYEDKGGKTVYLWEVICENVEFVSSLVDDNDDEKPHKNATRTKKYDIDDLSEF